MKSSVNLVLSILIFGVMLQSGCNNSTGVEPQKFPFIRFSKTYAGAEALDVLPTPDGGFISIGLTSNDNDLLLFKTDKYGLLEWSRIFTGQKNIYPHSCLITDDGGYLILSVWKMDSQGYGKLLINKTDNKGNDIWIRSYEDSLLYDGNPITLQAAADGGSVIAFSSYRCTDNKRDIIFKISETGDVLWRRVLTSGQDGHPLITQTVDNGYLIIAAHRNGFIIDSTVITELDDSGNTITETKYDYKFIPFSLITLYDGGYLASGCIDSISASLQACLMKINSSGKIEWIKLFQDRSNQYVVQKWFHSVVETIDGDLIIVGSTNRTIGTTPSSEAWIMEADKNGNEIWSYILPGNRGTDLYSVKHVKENMYIAAGYTLNGINFDQPAWLLNFENPSCAKLVTKK